MALLFVDSFDHYQTADLPSKWRVGVTTPTVAPGAGRCATAALVLPAGSAISRGLPFGSSAGTLGFAASLSVSGAVRLARVAGALGDHLTLTAQGDGSLAVAPPTGAAFGASVPGVILPDHWYFVEWGFLIAATGGWATVRVNGVVVLQLTGLATLPPPATDPAVRAIGFDGPTSGSGTWRLDDLYVLDDTGLAPLQTFLGDVRVEYLRPRAPGAAQAWTPVGAPSHWQAVDDGAAPDGDTSYVEATAAGRTDTNKYTLTGLPSGLIFGAQLSLYARKSDTGPRIVAPVANSVIGAGVGPSAETYQYFTTPYGTNPATGLPWTIAAINAAEFGVTVVS